MTANDNIQARIDELMAASAAKAGVTIDRIVAEMAKIGFSDVRRALTWGMSKDKDGSAIQ